MNARPYPVRVLNYHLDGYAHVNNARYLEFLEAARWDFFMQQNLHEALRRAQLVVSRMDIRYRRAAKLDDALAVSTQIAAVQSRRIDVSQRIVFAADGALCVQADVTLMPTDDAGRVFRLPENLMAAFSQALSQL